MQVQIIGKQFYRKKRPGLPLHNPFNHDKINSFKLKDGKIQDLLFEMDSKQIKGYKRTN